MHEHAIAIEELAAMRNLGAASARMLYDAGVRSVDELRALGAVEAFRRVLFARGGRSTAVLLWALHGALTDQRWDRIPAEEKAVLRAALEGGA
jgi:DNA transformation protein